VAEIERAARRVAQRCEKGVAMRTGRKFSAQMFAVVVGIALFSAVLAAGAVRAAQQASQFGPAIGDIVDLPAGMVLPPGRAVRIGVRMVDGSAACLLDITDMAASGGSLIIESRTGDRYGVHWAGNRTSEGSGNCGAARDLLISHADLDQIATVIGGFGVAGSRRPAIVPQPSAAMP
jgi:hypothetical protein